ncbi:hypothetical protein [Lacinutrix undariae]
MFVVVIPTFQSKINVDEFSLLYGKRFIKDTYSFSASVGVSLNELVYNSLDNNMNTSTKEQYIGFPFEVNIRLFKRKKERIRVLYGLIPIGKPTSFGRSIGLKLYGNIGRVNYVGLGVNTSLGWHKKY